MLKYLIFIYNGTLPATVVVCSGLIYEIYSGGGPSMYIYCVVCYPVIAAAYVRSVGCVFAYIYILAYDSERLMDIWDFFTP